MPVSWYHTLDNPQQTDEVIMTIGIDPVTDKGCPYCCRNLIQAPDYLVCPTLSEECGYRWDDDGATRTLPPIPADELERARLTNPIYLFQSGFAKSFATLIEVFGFDFACVQLDQASKTAQMDYETSFAGKMYYSDEPRK